MVWSLLGAISYRHSFEGRSPVAKPCPGHVYARGWVHASPQDQVSAFSPYHFICGRNQGARARWPVGPNQTSHDMYNQPGVYVWRFPSPLTVPTLSGHDTPYDTNAFSHDQSMTTRVRDAATGKRYVCRLLACRGAEEVQFLLKETYRIQVGEPS